MKRIISIFFCILTLCVFMPNDGWSEQKCNLHACKVDEDTSELLSERGLTNRTGLTNSHSLLGQRCFHCDAINDDDDCSHRDIVATVNAGAISVFLCHDDAGTDDTWEKLNFDLDVLPVCASSLLVAEARGNTGVADPILGHDDARITRSQKLSSSSSEEWGDQTGFCVFLSCKPGFTATPDKKSCYSSDTETNCDDSHGDWDDTTMTCICDTGKGLTGPDSNGKCSCATAGYQWNGTECVNPDQQNIDICGNSGGTWNNGACDCTGLVDMTERGGVCVCVDSAMVKVTDPTTGKVIGCTASKEMICESYGGEWNTSDDTCDCDANPDKNLTDDTLVRSGEQYAVCKCKNTDYDWVTGSPGPNGCKLTDDARARIDAFNEFKKQCTDWHGEWSPDINDDAARDQSTWQCNCDTDAGQIQSPNRWTCHCDDTRGYVLKNSVPPYECELTDYATLKANCDATPGARWVDTGAHGRRSGECKCPQGQVYIYDAKQCVDDSRDAALCSLISGAKIINGKCLCESTHRAPVNFKCPAANSTPVPSGPDRTILERADKLKKEINAKSEELKGISDTFGRSRWKTASGNFNGARLASDSIAGVVLGTVGGVVTSNVIKKNQVKGGFEDINCTVGGQMVADYGDQFQVGIR